VEGAFSADSKVMPKPSQTTQIIANPFGSLVGICKADFLSKKAAKRNMIA
jgi:hypothetical protein